MEEELEQLVVRGYRYALALTHDASRAEDLVQDAWVAILRRDGPRHAGYLMRTIRNRFLDLEKRRRLVAVEPLDAARDLPAAESQLAFLDLSDLGSGLEALRPIEREALYLAAVEGYTVVEIANLTGQPLGTVSSLIGRARTKLRSFLGSKKGRCHG